MTTIARTFTLDAERVDTPALLTGYALALLMCWAYSRRCRAGVFKDRRIDAAETERDTARAERDHAIAQRDEALDGWRHWAARALAAETERDQGVPTRLGRRCLTTTGGAT